MTLQMTCYTRSAVKKLSSGPEVCIELVHVIDSFSTLRNYALEQLKGQLDPAEIGGSTSCGPVTHPRLVQRTRRPCF